MPEHHERNVVPPFALATLATAAALAVAVASTGTLADAQAPTATRARQAATTPSGLAEDAALAVSADSARAEQAIASLRSHGPAGYEALTRAHAAAIATLRDAPVLPLSPESERLRHAIDVVSGQRDGHASGLYFHADLDAALAEARTRHVPVLSLRMLGHLDQELSCANSRYFRTILYSDPGVAAMLRDHFVLHVSMEREAPIITIDMGDGRRLTRTITGNSVHYVLDERGRVLDALPGLYAPTQFLEALVASGHVVTACGSREGSVFSACLVREHAAARVRLEASWGVLASSVRGTLPTWEALTQRDERRLVGPGAPSARAAMAETMSKMLFEAPMLDAFARTPTPQPYEGINWPALVNLSQTTLAPRTLALLRMKTGLPEAEVGRLSRELARNALADGLRNEFQMHRHVHDWFSVDGASTTFAEVNVRVYSELFLTPQSDPWLGLRSNDVWDGIESVR